MHSAHELDISSSFRKRTAERHKPYNPHQAQDQTAERPVDTDSAVCGPSFLHQQAPASRARAHPDSLTRPALHTRKIPFALDLHSIRLLYHNARRSPEPSRNHQQGTAQPVEPRMARNLRTARTAVAYIGGGTKVAVLLVGCESDGLRECVALSER